MNKNMTSTTTTVLTDKFSKTRKYDINYIPILFISLVHILTFYGCYTVSINRNGVVSFLVMWVLTALGVTIGYHRLFAHRSYKAILPWRAFWAFWGSGACQGSVLWWSRLHRLHHSFPDTPADPYGPEFGFWWSHIFWMIRDVDRTEYFKKINVNDLKKDKVVMFQHKYFIFIQYFVAFIVPLLIWSDDLLQAFIYGGLLARVCCWHSTWFVNSLAHWLGSDQHSNETSARDHFFTALLTFGEGNHGFHHAFAFSYQNGLNWYSYDPTKLLIEIGSFCGMTYDLKHPKQNEIEKAKYQVIESKLLGLKQSILWPDPKLYDENFIIIDEYKKAKENNKLWIAMSNKVYDVTDFASEHPGGEALLLSLASKSPEIIEKTYNDKHMHSKAARNMMDMMLIGRLVDNNNNINNNNNDNNNSSNNNN